MAPWFYFSPLADVGTSVVLDAREARHATGARRLDVGDAVCLFDGAGRVMQAVITSATSREVVLEGRSHEHYPPPTPHVHLAAALPKGDRQSTMLSMATQLGMSAFTPLQCSRSIARPTASFADRTRRIFIESCKQSRRPHLPAIFRPCTIDDLAHNAGHDGSLLVLAHPGGEPARPVLDEQARLQRVVLLVGPEGGFTDEEVVAAQKGGAKVVSLGSGVLRIETAAVALLALVLAG